MEFKNIVPGMTFEKEFIVEEGDTASHFGNDKVPVFASPRLISWIEGTAIGTVAPFLPEGWETVGTTFDLAHLAATFFFFFFFSFLARWHEGARGNRGDRGEGQDADLLCKGV